MIKCTEDNLLVTLIQSVMFICITDNPSATLYTDTFLNACTGDGHLFTMTQPIMIRFTYWCTGQPNPAGVKTTPPTGQPSFYTVTVSKNINLYWKTCVCYATLVLNDATHQIQCLIYSGPFLNEVQFSLYSNPATNVITYWRLSFLYPSTVPNGVLWQPLTAIVRPLQHSP